MLRSPGSYYEGKRSNTLLKVKSVVEDEAVVVGHQAGKGKNSGRLGALIVRNKQRIQFKIGSGFTDLERDDPPEVGSTVKYCYQELTEAGKPRFPTYVSKNNN